MNNDTKNNNAKNADAKNNKKRIIDNSEDLKAKITESIDDFKLRAELLIANLKEGGDDGHGCHRVRQTGPPPEPIMPENL